MISIALIEDNRLVREGMAALLSKTKDFKVIATSSAGDQAVLKQAGLNVVLLDVGLWEDPDYGFAAIAKRDHPDAKIVIMDLLPLHDDIVDFVNAGISGFIMKDATFEELVSTIRSVADGKPVLPPQMTSSLFSQIAKEAVVKSRAMAIDSVRMTAREREVVGLIGEGLSNKEIASRLNIATHTVKSHVRNVMEKLALHTRLQIAAFSHRGADS